MQKTAGSRSKNVGRNIARLLGLSFLSAFIFSAVVAMRHMLDTPQQLESPLPGEPHYYKWKPGHIFYKVLGAPEAPALLLLHTPELAASAYEMRKIIEPLAEHYRVYAPDLLGFGLSDRPAIDYSAETYVNLCRDFLMDVIRKPATIVASRISCTYAVATAANFPELCTGLVLISPVTPEGEQEKGAVQEDTRLPMLMRNNGRLVAIARSELLEAAPVKWLLYPMLSTHFALRYLLARQHAQLSDADIDYYYATMHQFGAEHASMALLAGKLERGGTQQVEAAHQPTLVMWGAGALAGAGNNSSERDVFQTMAHARPALIPDAGLAIHEEHPETVVAAIQQWSEEVMADVTPKVQTTIEAYCMKCKTKRKVLNPTEVTMKNGRLAVRGTCEVCGTGLYRIGRVE
ncbi:MAG TPA: alpha/beta fold hydrolase [Ktedonobacteraceae bacterium]|nr:alpha/beta fold hydrolase [Ktedonobacteraceae bacterium]